MSLNEILMERSGIAVPKTKGQWLIAKRNIVLKYMLGTNISLRNIASAVTFLDDIIKQIKSPKGWTDSSGVTHHVDDPYKGKIGEWPPNAQPEVSHTGTPDPYDKDTKLRASKY